MSDLSDRIDEIWAKAQVVEDYDSTKYRKDACGAWIIKDQYGKRDNPFGWEVDHIYPESKLNGKKVPQELIDDIDNLRPLNWMNNDSKGADFPSYQAKITSDGNTNVEGTYQLTVNSQVVTRIEELFKGFI